MGVGTREVYFDDFKVTQIKSPVVQTDDYYPFGLRYNSYSRENSLQNKTKLFQGQEHIDDLGLNWYSFKWRNHQPDIGRFFNVDPLSEKYVYNSPYAFSENHVTSHVELEGLEKLNFNIALFEANKGEHPFRSPDQATAPKNVQNKNFTETHTGVGSTKQELSFTADFEKGTVTNQQGENNDVNVIDYAVGKVTGNDPYKLDFKVESEGNLNINITVGDAKFSISGKSDGTDVTMSTKISGVSKGDAAVVKTSGDGQGLPVVVGHKQSGAKDAPKQNEVIPYSNDKGVTRINSSYIDSNNKKFQSTPTRKNEN